MKQITVINSSVLEDLFRDHYEALTRYAFTILKDNREAEDVVQKLFIKLWEKRNELEIMNDVRAYLYRSTYNSSLNALKRLNRTTEMTTSTEVNISEGSAKASDRVLSAELEDRIEQALDRLPEKCGEVFRLSRFQELTYKEISEQLNVSIKTVENHMGKALRIMRKELEEYLPIILITILLSKGW